MKGGRPNRFLNVILFLMIVIVAELVSIIECHYPSNLGGTLSAWGLLGSGEGGDTSILSKFEKQGLRGAGVGGWWREVLTGE